MRHLSLLILPLLVLNGCSSVVKQSPYRDSYNLGRDSYHDGFAKHDDFTKYGNPNSTDAWPNYVPDND